MILHLLLDRWQHCQLFLDEMNENGRGEGVAEVALPAGSKPEMES